MSRFLAALLLVSIAYCGCRPCSNCYDYSSPVANSPYAGHPGRAGSAMYGGTLALEYASQELEATDDFGPANVPQPPPSEDGMNDGDQADIELTIPNAPPEQIQPATLIDGPLPFVD